MEREVTDMNRVRNKQMIIRMTDTEVSEFDRKMRQAHFKSRADFINALLRDVRIVVPDGIKEIAVELKREGNNLNQALRLWNKTQTPAPPIGVTIAYEKLSKLYSQISGMLEGVKNADFQSSGEDFVAISE
jgi:hypothetical protein